MNNMYKRCIYCGEELSSDETRCRYCLKWQNRFDDVYGSPPQYDDRYENLNNDPDDDSYHNLPFTDENNYIADERHSHAPRRQLGGVEIGGIIVVVVLAGFIIGLLLFR